MGSSDRSGVPKRLHYLKCSKCRKHKKKCLPLDRSWPGEKCHRCAVYNYACSAGMTASQDKQLQQGQIATSLMPPPLRPTQSSGVDLIIHDSQQGNQRLPGGQTDDKPNWPKCAPYFSYLIKASWGYFGRPWPSETDIFDRRLMDISAIEPNSVYHCFKSRLYVIDLCRRYQGFVRARIARGVGLEESRVYAAQRMAYEAGNNETGAMSRDDKQVTDLVLSLESSRPIALRWQSLMDAVGVPEILLICYDDEETEMEWENLPLPDLASVSDKEWPSLFQSMLSPELGLKETCLKLSGVIDMIERLQGLEGSELRTYLATSIKKRVESALGTEYNLLGHLNEEDDDSMADFE